MTRRRVLGKPEDIEDMVQGPSLVSRLCLICKVRYRGQTWRKVWCLKGKPCARRRLSRTQLAQASAETNIALSPTTTGLKSFTGVRSGRFHPTAQNHKLQLGRECFFNWTSRIVRRHVNQCPCPSSPPLCSGSSLIRVSILMTAIQASTALFNCFTLLMLGSKTPALI